MTVDAIFSAGLTVKVTPPETIKEGEYTIPCNAVSANETLSMDLTVKITGSYEVGLSTPSGQLSFDAYANSAKSVTLSITNNASHQLYQIQQVCDRVGIFVEGTLIACGNIDDLGRQLEKESHYSLELKPLPCDEGVKDGIMEMDGVQDVEQDKDTLLIRSNQDIRSSVTAFLGKNGYTILHMHQKGGDLDEIYRLYFEKAGTVKG